MKQLIFIAVILYLLPGMIIGQPHRKGVHINNPINAVCARVPIHDVRGGEMSTTFALRQSTHENPIIHPPHNLKQCLDSMIEEYFSNIASQWINEYKKEFGYDAAGNVTRYILYQWNEIKHLWDLSSKTEYQYDNSGNIIEQEHSQWNAITIQWNADSRDIYSYSSTGNVTEQFTYFWDASTSTWTPYEHHEYIYLTSGNLSQYIYSLWDLPSGHWIPDCKDEYLYDLNDQLITYNFYGWNPILGQWVHYRKGEFTYDTVGNLTKQEYSAWSISASQWMGETRDEFWYDANSNVTQHICSAWHNASNQWNEVLKNEYLYNIAGNLAQRTYSEWNPLLSAWKAIWKEEYIYNTIGCQTQYFYYEWDEIASLWTLNQKRESLWDTHQNLLKSQFFFRDTNTNQWVGDIQQEYGYNYAYTKYDLYYPCWLPSTMVPFEHMLTNKTTSAWDYNTQSWEYSGNVFLYYSDAHISGINEKEPDMECNVYPNPANESVVFQTREGTGPIWVELYNQDGRLVMREQPDADNRIVTGSLDNGTYFYKVIGKEAISNGKLMILK